MKTAWVATIVIVLSVPLYLARTNLFNEKKDISDAGPQFVGKEACIDCHKIEYDLWTGSDHDLAMDYANENTVKGNFDNQELERDGKVHKFYRKNGGYYVWTDGPDGNMAEFEVKYTFGYHPLQQYLVELDGGRLQTLALTWDTISGSWYHMADAVYSGQEIDHNNWLHWTKGGQNWNGMCADCHSTNLRKAYNIKSDIYNTTWSEIDVSCEACHGPSSEHIKWAQLPDMARPGDVNFGLVVQTSNIDNRRYVDLCARCHSRRTALEDYTYDWSELPDHMIPQLIREPLYFADGQILEEVYVYGSFTQSKMYMRDVQCNDCHNVHSGRIIAQGNSLCNSCHQPEVYDTYEHHFHKYSGVASIPVTDEFGKKVEVGEGALCINCHMTGRYYMGVDYRRDHSFRIPRPDLAAELGTPDACTKCHANRTHQWAGDQIRDWYGRGIKPHYGAILAQGHEGDPDALPKLTGLVESDLYPVIIRATALSLLGEYYGDTALPAIKNGLRNIEPLIRYTAIHHHPLATVEDVSYIIPLLNDPVKAVRFEAAVKLSPVPRNLIPQKSLHALTSAQNEYKEAMEYNGDFPTGRHNLGNLYDYMGDQQKAEDNYLAAIRIDGLFHPAKVNLAMLYNRQGKNEKALQIFREVAEAEPELAEINYSLGLLLAEMGNYNESAIYLEKASRQMHGRSRIFYNLGLIYQALGNMTRAESSLAKALQLEPESFDCMYALADHYIKVSNLEKALQYAQKIMEKYPDDPSGQQLKNYIEDRIK